jgi:hypothetical protein
MKMQWLRKATQENNGRILQEGEAGGIAAQHTEQPTEKWKIYPETPCKLSYLVSCRKQKTGHKLSRDTFCLPASAFFPLLKRIPGEGFPA